MGKALTHALPSDNLKQEPWFTIFEVRGPDIASHTDFANHANDMQMMQIGSNQFTSFLTRPRIAKAACGGGFSVVLSSEGEARKGFCVSFQGFIRDQWIQRTYQTLDQWCSFSNLALIFFFLIFFASCRRQPAAASGLHLRSERQWPSGLPDQVPGAVTFSATNRRINCSDSEPID